MSFNESTARRFADQATLVRELSLHIAADLRAAIATRGVGSLLVSGGKSPLALFDCLRGEALDWQRVEVGLADERWVDAADPSSNEKLVRDHLLQGAAAAARFSGLKNAASTPDLGAADAWTRLGRVARPFDVVVLGMGDDGHTASLFPHSPNLALALDSTAAPGCVGMQSPTAPSARLSLNLSALLDSRRIVLLLLGDAKWRVYETATGAGSAHDMPVRSVLRQQHTPVEVFWAP